MRCASRSRSRCSGSLNRRWDSVNFPCAASIACAANGASLPWPGTSGGSSPSSRPDTADAPRPSGREGPGNADIRPFNRFLRPIQRQASPQPAKIILGNQPRPQSDRLLDVVYNHTAEGAPLPNTGATFAYPLAYPLYGMRGLDNGAYYELAVNGQGAVNAGYYG